jgi:hypothetical protein
LSHSTQHIIRAYGLFLWWLAVTGCFASLQRSSAKLLLISMRDCTSLLLQVRHEQYEKKHNTEVQQEQEEAARRATKFKVGWLSKGMRVLSYRQRQLTAWQNQST